ncbi:PREDICTED: neuroligin 4-like [Habropoda laboriosa]|uniref:neuroligin 4-like n=1 Tax=Habropoda laboriosa TaxID=597456 RepID=UPI00083CCC29|nr:PREDICTED: neuroligin 4-like [Habropoda laboriosa]
MTSSILALLGLILATASAELSSRIVRTKYGELSGAIVTLDRHLEGVEVFRGVPYASPPIGSLRFMPPVSGAIWHGVKVADKFGPVCPQRLPELTDKMPKGRVDYLRRLLPYLRNQSEDCLYLNIYAPVQVLYTCDEDLLINDSLMVALGELWYGGCGTEQWSTLRTSGMDSDWSYCREGKM